MIEYPQLREQPSSRQMLDVFKGYNCNLRISEGEFRDMENLTSDYYPALSPRAKRATVTDINNLPPNALPREGKITGVAFTDVGNMVYVQGPNLYRHNAVNDPVPLGLMDYKTRFVKMGQYLIIWPDMKYVNMHDFDDYGSFDHSVEIREGKVSFELCKADGEIYDEATVAESAPENPGNNSLWIDTSASPHALRQYSVAQDEWVAISTTYVKITGLNTGSDGGTFSQYDGVTISGIVGEASHLNGAAILQSSTNDDSIVIVGMLDHVVTQDCATDGTIRIERKAPVMDHVVEAGNRLWGCRYGPNNNGEFVNEIYASKLGDFKNWSCFMGISTDSWVGSLGSEGGFTGAVNMGENPVFYKSGMKHKVWISDSGAHQITSIPCQGPAWEDSIATIDGAVIYRSHKNFCIDDGSGPAEIGQCFANAVYLQAIGCAAGHKYYVSMMDDDDNWHLFTYDAQKKVWHREDDFKAVSFATDGYRIFAVKAETDDGNEGNVIIELNPGEGFDAFKEDTVKWMAETGEIGLSSPDMKYISRLTLRLSMEVGAELTIYAQYDMEPEWVALGSIRGTSLRSFSLPIRPRRCDHLRLRFEGEGDVKIYSITKTIEEGSDIS